MAKFLEENEFSVTSISEVNDPEIISSEFTKFDNNLKLAKENFKIALFVYYSGHGFLVDGVTVGMTLSRKQFPLEEKI